MSVDIKENKSEDAQLNEFMTKLYDVSQVSDEEIKEWNEAYAYKGFNRKKVIKDLMKKVPDVKVAQQIIMICGLLGPQRASLVKLLNNKTIASYGIPASGMKGSDGVSCQRITAATADLCAFFLKKINVPKRLNLPCPGWLQFPSAGSIRLPRELREMHMEFSVRFSTVIGGIFNEQIYNQMAANSYLDENLGLFDAVPVSDITEPASNLQVPQPAPTFNPARGDVGVTKTANTSRGAGRGNQ